METEYPPVLNKPDFVRRYSAGEFGNASPTWTDLGAFIRIGAYGVDGQWPKLGLYHLRNREAAGETHYNLTHDQCCQLWISKSLLHDWYVSEMAPTERTILQGEVLQGCYGTGGAGVDLYYTTVRKPMRDALAEEARSASGIIATGLLRNAMCPNSYEWLMVLLERYPGHVVEFSTYEVEWGTLPGFNSVFWEVRAY